MGTGLLTRKAQIAVEEEGAEGTAETLVDADAGMLVYDPTFSPEVAMFARDPARSSLTPLEDVVGKQLARIGWRTELKGSGAVATVPAFDDAIRACGFARATVSTIAIGAVTGGPFLPGETVTGAPSGGTGRVVGEVRTGTTPLPYVVLTGVLASGDTLTGGTSGATATASAGPQASKGFEYRPSSSSVISATVGLYTDGVRQLVKGARGTVRLEARIGEPVFLLFDFQGVYGGTTDTALLAPTYESTVPVAFLNVAGSVGGLAAVFGSLSIDVGNDLSDRESARETTGAVSVKITARNPRATIDPEMELVATHDFCGRLLAGTTGRLYSELPAAAGQKVVIGCPRIQYSQVGRGDRNRILVAEVECKLVSAGVSSGDDEIQIGVL
jgi:hypothetical protein